MSGERRVSLTLAAACSQPKQCTPHWSSCFEERRLTSRWLWMQSMTHFKQVGQENLHLSAFRDLFQNTEDLPWKCFHTVWCCGTVSGNTDSIRCLGGLLICSSFIKLAKVHSEVSIPHTQILILNAALRGVNGEKKRTWKLKNLSKEICDVKMDFIKSIYYLYH